MKKLFFLSILFSFIMLSVSAQQKLKDGTIANGNLPSKEAILELESNNKGLLHVRIPLIETTDPSPLSAHVAGMMVYNTALSKDVVPGIYYNDGSSWVLVRNSKNDSKINMIEGLPGKTGTPGKPGSGASNAPSAGVTVVTNDSGTWGYNPTTQIWTNINNPGVNGKSVVLTNNLDGSATITDGNGNAMIVKNGINGIGVTGSTYNAATGVVTFKYSDGSTSLTKDLRGSMGATGKDGVHGNSITGSSYDAVTGVVTFRYSDGSTSLTKDLRGTVGAPGKDGKSITSGVGAPSASTGKAGDSYVDTTTGDVYKKGADGQWVKGDNIKGKDGSDGKSITFGTGAPSVSTGKPGDSYVDTTTGDVYKKGADGQWVKGDSIKGKDGKDGSDGKSITFGTGAPSVSTGKPGDSYVDTTTGDVYKKGADGQWVKGDSIKGKDGKDGAEGKSITSGTGAPSASTGKPGDSYVDTTTGDVYKKGADGQWVKGDNIKGKDGKDGSDGKSITFGTSAPSVSTGKPGDSYVDTTTGDVYKKGADGQWVKGDSIKGKDGKDGSDGKSITSGTGAPSASTGKPGDSYIDATTGDVYTKGADGLWGKGDSIKGKDGKDGGEGKSITFGTGAPSASTGKAGDSYVDTTTGDVYKKGADGQWVKGDSIKGKDGKDGSDGKSITFGTGAPSVSTGKPGDSYVDTTTGDVYKKGADGLWEKGDSIKGKDGKDGSDGKSITSGTGAPSASTGKPGDSYIDATTGDVYTKGADGQWVKGDNIKGKDGKDGSDGKSITSGTGVPSASTGKPGDSYIDTTTGDVYKKGADGQWVKGDSIKGKNGIGGVSTPGEGIKISGDGTINKPYIINNDFKADNGLTKTAENVQLGGALIDKTTITTDATKTLAIAGLQNGNVTDKIVVAGANGVLKQVSAAAPKFFYMPSIVLDTDNPSKSYTVDLYNQFKKQFTNIDAKLRNPGSTVNIPFMPLVGELDYYITYVDSSVINITSVSNDGLMTYTVVGPVKAFSFVNIVFVVK